MNDCAESIREKLGPDAVPCNTNGSCEEFADSTAFHRICNCLDWQGNPIPDCDPRTWDYPIATVQCVNSQTGEISNVSMQECQQMGAPWELQQCFCCCGMIGSAPSAAAAAAPAGERPAADVLAGDQIDVAQLGDGGTLSWHAKPVAFARDASDLPAVGIAFGDDAATVADADALFLQPSGLLKRADALMPGCDVLVAPDGRELPVLAVRRGRFRGQLRQIAAALPSYEEFAGPDGHLIARDGVVAGDYVTQLYQHTEKMAPHLSGRAGGPRSTNQGSGS